MRIEDNIQMWNAPSSWDGAEAQWSGPWGGSDNQWWGSLLPRLHAFLPVGTILELGPGHGRWTHYLRGLCEQLILVDVAENCIEACRARFVSDRHITYHVGDGMSLPEVGEHSVDLVFSFDSLVHAEADALGAYVRELARVLTSDGIAFIHHSNMGELRAQAALARRVPDRWRWPLIARGLIVNLDAWRAESTSAVWFTKTCEQAGLVCVAQEKVAWEHGRYLTDVISVLTRPGSRWERPNVVVSNPGFMREARRIADSARLYSPDGFPRLARALRG